MAPEVALITPSGTQSYGYAADIWSFGIFLLELAEGQPPWYDRNPREAMTLIGLKPAPTLKDPKRWSQPFRDFVAATLVRDPAKRKSAKELLIHPFIEGASEPAVVGALVHEMKAKARR